MIELAESHPGPNFRSRLLASNFGQRRRTPRCPDRPRLDGRLAVVTGATGGIGFEIARGLRARGAELILPCRSAEKGARVAERLRADTPGAAPIDLVPFDMEDLASAGVAAREIESLAAARSIDLLVENAGIWPAVPARTKQGHEIAFGVNVLAHFALRRPLLERGRLAGARVVVVTGDIYILERDCTPDYDWRGRVGGMRAYCRSKLGNLWIAGELARRHPELRVHTVHPGVVDTNLGGKLPPWLARIRSRVFIEPELGAQMPLVAATQDGLEHGGYYHNVMGHMRLDPRDRASDRAAAAALWALCEKLVAA